MMVAMGVCTPVDPALAESLDKPFAWAVGFFFGNAELSLELWKVHQRFLKLNH